MTRIGIIGTGGIAHAHANGYDANTDQATVTTLCDIDPANMERMAKRYPDARKFTDWKELLASDVDAVSICLPHHLHQIAILDSAKAGKHVLIEKPLCTNWKDAEEIRTAVADTGITVMCAHNQLFDPAVERARKALDDGLVGDVWTIRTCDCFSMIRPEKTEWGWRGSMDTMGGGCLIDTGYHPSYMLMYLANAEPETVFAMIDKHSASGLDGEDSAEVLVRFKNGVRGTILTSWAFESPANMWQVHVTGSKGQLYGRGSDLYFKPLGFPEPAKMTLEKRNSFEAQIKDFIRCIESGDRPRHNQEDGIAVLRIILGAYESVKTGCAARF